MELKLSSPNPGGLSPPGCVSDPEEKEISDDDDDDRNHKHRRQDTRSQSLEGDASEQVLTRPSRKNTKPFGNGYSFRGSDPHSSETWKSYHSSQPEKDFPVKFEKKHSSLPTFSQAHSDLNQRIRVNQSFYVDHGPGRGRGWDSRFSLVNVASQMIHQVSAPPSLFAGRGLSTASNSQNASWGPFGLIPGMANGGLDALHSLGLQGALRPSVNPSLSIGIPRQRCRDFEERGFCLRGDMCSMEHGGNQIVVEDVQSLSQFNLPISLPSAHILGNAAGPGPGRVPSVSVPSSTLMHSKGVHNKSSKRDLAEDRFSLNNAFSGSVGGADLYDPDQPLWTNDCPEASAAFLAPHSPNADEAFLLDADASDRHLGRLSESTEIDIPVGSTGTTGTSSTVWGRIGGSKNRIEMKKKTDLTVGSSSYRHNETMKDQEALAKIQGNTHQGTETIAEGMGPKSGRNVRRPSQKALRTLFVNGIPHRSNKTDALLSHFRKFGEVIDIYIPSNSERAFVQFSKREEAEAALMAPDAVMGNRFIKLWWANRDHIPDDGISSANNALITHRGTTTTSVLARLAVANTPKDGIQPGAPKGSISHTYDTRVHASDHPNPLNSDSPKALPSQKKLENLELLKKELRKKQEMLDQKRNDFRRQLFKLEKATSFKSELVAEHGAKKQKLESVASFMKDACSTSTDVGALMASAQAETMMENKKSGETVASQTKAAPTMILQKSTNPKQQICPSSPVGTPFLRTRFKSDSSPMAFRISPPLPAGFGNVSIIKEHFLSYGELSSVELEESETQDGGNDFGPSKNCSALINFATRQSAEGAFLNGKCWQGHNLQFIWLTSSNASNEHVGREQSPPAPEVPSDASIEPVVNLECMVSKEATSSGNGATGSSERSKGGVEHTEQDEEFQSCSIPISSEKQSSNDRIC